jgi:hypothetical protein
MIRESFCYGHNNQRIATKYSPQYDLGMFVWWNKFQIDTVILKIYSIVFTFHVEAPTRVKLLGSRVIYKQNADT